MTNLEKIALTTLAEHLEELASLEKAGFDMNEERNKTIKENIYPYMSWFYGIAEDIKKIVELTEKTGCYKKYKLEEIIRLNLT